jgi:membrane protein implicated in regulation of membrane protease activity
MLGKRGVVESVRAAEATVRVASELWRVRSLDGAVPSVGEEVVVRDVDGLCLLVEAVRGEAS